MAVGLVSVRIAEEDKPNIAEVGMKHIVETDRTDKGRRKALTLTVEVVVAELVVEVVQVVVSLLMVMRIW